MENSPFHSSGSANQSAPAPEPASSPEPERKRPAPKSHARATSTTAASSGKGLKLGSKLPKVKWTAVLVALAVVAIIILVATWLMAGRSGTLAIDGSKYQAVTLMSGDIYFGKLKDIDGQYMRMSDIFYLKPQANDDNATGNPQSSANQNFSLTKFTAISYGPEDEMTIPRNQILHFENVKKDGRIAQLIEQYKKAN